MQTQEMFWKHKYDSLEENYNNLKCNYDQKYQNTIKTGKLRVFCLFSCTFL